MKLMILLYNVIVTMVLAVVLPFLPVMALFSEKRRATLLPRLGILTGIRKQRTAPKRIWVHALSVGEVRSAMPLVKALNGQGREIVASVSFRTDEGRTFMDISEELLTLKPDGVLVIANSMDSALICQQIRKVDSDMLITLADWGATERLLELGGKAVEGVTVMAVEASEAVFVNVIGNLNPAEFEKVMDNLDIDVGSDS